MGTLLDVYTPEFWAQETLLQLYPNITLPALVHTDFSDQLAERGDVVNTRLPATLSARTVDSTWVGVEPTATNVAIPLDQWKEVQFLVSDKTASLAIKDFRNEFAKPAAEALSQAVDDAVIGLYKDIYQFKGTAGTTPAAIDTMCTNPKQLMDEANVPSMDRRMVINPTVENKYHQLFYNAQTMVSPEFSQINGVLSRRFGFDFFGSNRMGSHTPGTWVDGTVNGVNAAGSTSLIVASAGVSKTVGVGDLFTIDSGPAAGQYVVTAATTTSGAEAVTLTISPGLRGATAGGEVVTPIAAHGINLAFHRQAFALVSRPLAMTSAPGMGAMMTTASANGITFRVTIFYDGNVKSMKVCLDILFGVKTLDARKAMRLLS